MTKLCSRCNIEKSLSDFNKKPNLKSGLQPYCKNCQHEYHKRWYENNKASVVKRVSNNNRRYIERNIALIKPYAEENGCCSCGEKDFIVLDFHHLDPSEKECTISELCHTGRSLSQLVKEVNKCAILCSNCHRRYHAGTLKVKLKQCNLSIPD